MLDGVTVLPAQPEKSIYERVTTWVTQLDKIAERKNRYFRSLAEAAERISAHNKRLTPEQALHLASHGVRRNADGSYSWKFDEYQRARAPYRLSPDDHIALWSRITCPTLLLRGKESFLPDPETAGVLAHFRRAHLVRLWGLDTGFITTNLMRSLGSFAHSSEFDTAKSAGSCRLKSLH